MKSKSIIIGIILLFVVTNFIPIISGNTSNSINNKTIENNLILQFYFDKQNWLLYLENIGDETAYNITISIHIDGFIVFGNEEDLYMGIPTLESGNKTSLIFFPFVLGFGPINIIYTAYALNADSTSITLKAFLIGPWPFLWGYYDS
jgi:hypothetical protein